jgi:glycolate oxidase
VEGPQVRLRGRRRISPSYFVQDGVIPRTKLPEVLADISRMADEVGLRVANVFHAGDGNLHPLVLFDDAVEGQAHDAEELAGAILDLCISSGGSITGEHGVGPGEAPQDGQAVHRRGPGHHAAGPLRVRPRRHRQPGQGLPDAAAVRRAARPRKGEHPCRRPAWERCSSRGDRDGRAQGRRAR